MKETELNETLLQIEQRRNELLPPPPARHTGRCYRRERRATKDARLRKIVTASYVPHAGYVDWERINGTMQPVGQYIKYPRNSNCQRWMKRLTGRLMRNCREIPAKGNYYRRLFDYWWTLY